jgi:hypothetical protein
LAWLAAPSHPAQRLTNPLPGSLKNSPKTGHFATLWGFFIRRRRVFYKVMAANFSRQIRHQPFKFAK